MIDLCLSVFPKAGFRTTKGAIKLHVGLPVGNVETLAEGIIATLDSLMNYEVLQ